ncbi:hypothetical protein ACWGDT_19980 [Streptomyces avermitilis]
MIPTKKIFATIALLLGLTAAVASPAMADNAMPVPPQGTAAAPLAP